MTIKKARSKLFGFIGKNLDFVTAVSLKKKQGFGQQAKGAVSRISGAGSCSLGFEEHWDSDYVQPYLDFDTVVFHYREDVKTVYLVIERQR